MENLIVAGIVLDILLLSLIISKKNKHFSDKFLILYLFVAVLIQAFFYLETESFFQQSNFMLLGKGVYLLSAPLFFSYVYTLLTSRKISGRLYAILTFPFVAYVLHFFYYYFFVFDHASLSIDSGILLINGNVSISWFVFVIVFLLIEPAYLIWFFILLRRYKEGLADSVSNIDHSQLRWLYLLFYLWLLITVILVPMSMLSVGLEWISHEVLQLLIQIATLTFLFILGYFGFRKTSVFIDYGSVNSPPSGPSKNPYQRSGLDENHAEDYHKTLLAFMENKKPYLNGELKASELAQMIGISTNHLSQVLSQMQEQNFFDFVNSYRVNEVIDKMKVSRNSHLTLLAMALDSGFNSKTSFNTVFKKFMHQTPSQYYKSLKADMPKSVQKGSAL